MGLQFSLPLHTLTDYMAFVGLDSNGACMTVMATLLVQGAPLEEAFFHAKQVDQLGKWLRHHDMQPRSVVQAFLMARAKGADVLCRTCP